MLSEHKIIFQQMIDSTQHAQAVPNYSNTGNRYIYLSLFQIQIRNIARDVINLQLTEQSFNMFNNYSS